MGCTEIELYDEVTHPEIYHGNEIFTVIGIRVNELELEGDWSGGTHNVRQRSWHKKAGTVIYKKHNWSKA